MARLWARMGRHVDASREPPPAYAGPRSARRLWPVGVAWVGRLLPRRRRRRRRRAVLWVGGVLLTVALFGLGLMLVKSDLLPLRLFVALALPTLVWGVFALVRDSVDATDSWPTPCSARWSALGSVLRPGTPVGALAARHSLTRLARPARESRRRLDAVATAFGPVLCGGRGDVVELTEADAVRRVAMISVHTSPLDQPGTGDAGGMNVYVVELSRAAGRRAASRSTSSPGPRRSTLPPAVEPRRRRHRPPRPRRPVRGADQGRAARPAVRLRPRGAARRGRQPLGPLRPRPLPLLALRPGRRAGPRPLGRPARAHDAHHGQGQERAARRRRHPRADGAGDRRGAGRRGRRHADRQHRHRGQAADRPVRRRPRPGRGRPPRRRPRRLPAARHASSARAGSGCPPDAARRCCSPAGSSRSRRPTCCCARSPSCSSATRSSASRLVVPVVGGPSGTGLEHPEALAELADRARHRRRRPVRAAGRAGRAAPTGTPPPPLVCVPSYNESFGLVAVEAQATGTPVVAAAVGGLTHRRARRRERAARRRPRAGGLGRRAATGARRRRACARGWRPGRSRPGRQFSWEATAERTLEVYERRRSSMRAEPQHRRDATAGPQDRRDAT